jgi:hypothetical protein
MPTLGCIIPPSLNAATAIGGRGFCPSSAALQHGTAHPATQSHPINFCLPQAAQNVTMTKTQSHSLLIRHLPYAQHRPNGTVPAVPSGRRCLPNAPHVLKAGTRRRLVGFPSCPGCGIVPAPWDPRPKIRGDSTRRAHPKTDAGDDRLTARNASVPRQPKTARR